jgi:hypothetical protein
MSSRRRETPGRSAGRRVSYARVAAALALFLSLTTGALAARRYVIGSAKQIKPGVLSTLRAGAGPGGVTGTAGSPGAKGQAGDAGGEGPVSAAPTVLEPGQTESGVWGGGHEITEGGTRYRVTASFPIQLALPLRQSSVGYVPKGTPPTVSCPGMGQAAPGVLCLYEGTSLNLKTPSAEDVFDPEEFEGQPPVTGRSGFAIELTSAGTEDPSSVTGTFAVTAPRATLSREPVMLRREGARL